MKGKKKSTSDSTFTDDKDSRSSSDSDLVEILPKKNRKSKNQLTDSEDELMKRPALLDSDGSSYSSKQKKGKRHGKRRARSSSSSDSNASGGRKRSKKKRSRIVVASDDSDADDLESSPTKGSQRKNIRKLISTERLGNLTKEAGKAEKDRRKRVLATQLLVMCFFLLLCSIPSHFIVRKCIVKSIHRPAAETRGHAVV